jgi:protein-L-isoaspartate(D-aspartate) O-methyltransferase
MDDSFQEKRDKMVESQLIPRGVRDERVLAAMRKVPRHLFVPESMQIQAYNDEPLPIGEGQTISQPYIVGYMSEVLQLKHTDRILEIGTGSGYQTAILAEIVSGVFSIEIIEDLSHKAQKILKELEYNNIRFAVKDGTSGWEEFAPFDKVIVTAAPAKIPTALPAQLKVAGQMVIPVGQTFQELVLLYKEKKKIKRKRLIPVRFVPLMSEKKSH